MLAAHLGIEFGGQLEQLVGVLDQRLLPQGVERAQPLRLLNRVLPNFQLCKRIVQVLAKPAMLRRRILRTARQRRQQRETQRQAHG